jgi:ferredoxin-NADP reductase
MKQSVEWQIAVLKAVKVETSHVKTFTLTLPHWLRHQPGQHYDIRLTAPDGYQAQRSYSIASEPEREDEIDLTVERIESGEVSTYLHDVLVPGDCVEMRGPIGGYFVWDGDKNDPLMLVAGGSGVVPLVAMLRHRAAIRKKVPTRLLYSSRNREDIIYADELEQLASAGDGLTVTHTLTRVGPSGWQGYHRRIDQEMLAEVLTPLGKSTQVYICGPTLLVEAASNDLVGLGLTPRQIRTERFGPTRQGTGV